MVSQYIAQYIVDLHGKILNHVKRAILMKAVRMVSQGRVLYVRPYGDGFIAMVKGDSGEVYRVTITLRKQACTCPYFSLRRKLCKHIVAAIIFAKGIVRRNLQPHGSKASV